MAKSFQQFIEDEMREAGYSDTEVTTALSKIYANDKLSGKLNGLVKTAFDDYQAQSGRVRALEDRDKARDKEVTDYYQRVNAEHSKVLRELNELKAGGTPTFDESKYVSKEDLGKFAQDMGGRFATVLKDATSIATSHAIRFQESLDLNAIEEIAQKENLPIRAAYEKFIEPRVKQAETDDRKKWEENKRAEIERDVRSRHKLPTDPVPAETAPVYQRVAKDKVPQDLDQELLAAWHGGDKK